MFDSILACFGTRFTVHLLPQARRYRVFPLGTFHFFDWQKTDSVGVSVGTCPQITSSETAAVGVRVDGVTRVLPFGPGDAFAVTEQHITPLTTTITASDDTLPVEMTVCFRTAFYPEDFRFAPPAYSVEITLKNTGTRPVRGEVFFGLPLPHGVMLSDGSGFRSAQPIDFPDGIDHDGVDALTFEQTLTTDADRVIAYLSDDTPPVAMLSAAFVLGGRESFGPVTICHAGYVRGRSLNVRGEPRAFGYTALWESSEAVIRWWRSHADEIARKSALFESTVMEATVSPALKDILSAAFKGLAANAWWASGDWFSIMEIGAYHSTLDVDAQSALFLLLYWPGLLARMLDQWQAFHTPGRGYMDHDIGQHLEVTGNRYGGPQSSMQVEENCNYILLLHHYWRVTADSAILPGKHALLRELVGFLVDCDTTGSGLPNRYTQNTNDWGSHLITASEEQSYHGVRMVAAFSAAAEIAGCLGDDALAALCDERVKRINASLARGWLGDHYPISLADPGTAHHYSMWTTHGLLYPLRCDMQLDIDLARLRTDLISSTAYTMREHGSVHSTADVRGWLTQNLWRDCVMAYLGLDPMPHLARYLGHGEYVSYEDTTILEVSNELMVVPGAVADHRYAGELHDHPLVDGHPRPACGFGLLYALAGLRFDRVARRLRVNPVVCPLKIALTTHADWQAERVPWMALTRTIPNQDRGPAPSPVTVTLLENADLLAEFDPLVEGIEP